MLEGPFEVGPLCVAPADGTCPRGCNTCQCAHPNTPVATPTGLRRISELRVGDRVFSVDHEQVVPVFVAEIRQRRALGHVVPQVTLSDGQMLEISAGHPTADGRTFGDLRAGDLLGGLGVVSVKMITYQEQFTYDILPASDTGFYFAGGALIGSTLARPPRGSIWQSTATE